MVEGKKVEGATRRVMGAWTLGAAWARHLADLATAKRNIVYVYEAEGVKRGRGWMIRAGGCEIEHHRQDEAADKIAKLSRRA